MRLNKPAHDEVVLTYEGGRTVRSSHEQQLRHSVMCCLLWENTFYESGFSIAQRIEELVGKVNPSVVSQIAIEARTKMNLRHVPLYIAVSMCKYPEHKKYVRQTLREIIQRPDELAEFLSIYSKDRTGLKKLNKLCNQAKLGLADAFHKFNEYSLAKYNQAKDIKLRDVLFLCHVKPRDEREADLYNRLIKDELKIPDTWEVELSKSKDKTASWTRLIQEDKLGALALLKNLRNASEAGVDKGLIKSAILRMRTDRVLPFRFISAAKHAPQFEPELEEMMMKNLSEFPKMKGKTVLLIDASGSMFMHPIAAKSDLLRFDAACALSILLRELCEDVEIILFSKDSFVIPPRRGFALRDYMMQKAPKNSTYLGEAVKKANSLGYDRLIVMTDEESNDPVGSPIGTGYMVNIATYKHTVGIGSWHRIDGWSEQVVRYIMEHETNSVE